MAGAPGGSTVAVTAQREHAGQLFSPDRLAGDDRLADDEELFAVGQDLALIGLRLDPDRLTAALDDAALTDAEPAAGPTAWAEFSDPFPVWQTAGDRADPADTAKGTHRRDGASPSRASDDQCSS